MLITQFCFAKLYEAFVITQTITGGCLFIAVHGFFGKFSERELKEGDVVETYINRDFFSWILKIAIEFSDSKAKGNASLNQLVNEKGNVLATEHIAIILRAILKYNNTSEHKVQSSDMLVLSTLLITAQRYQRPVYFI